jgi:predicted ATPase
LITIVGPAGIGKTRLALRYGIERRNDFSSVWFCHLREARDVEEMCDVVLRAIANKDRSIAPGVDGATACARAFAARADALIILDNLEHLLPDATPTIRRWMESAPRARFVTTSRQKMGVAEEEIIELGALALPAPGDVSSDAVELFVDRVRAHHGDYAPLDDELESIAEIVRQLRGVPLAIELVAARVGSEAARDLLPRVTSRSEPCAAPDPHSARRAIARAFALLAPTERDTLAQCSFFRGPFTLDAAARVVRVRSDDGSPLGVSEVVLGLARKNLLQVERYTPLRFAMAEGVRTYAGEALASSPEADAVEWRHADHFFERAAVIAGLSGDAPVDVVDAALDRDDLQAAMTLGARANRPAIVLRVALALDALSMGGGLSTSQLALLDDALRTGAAGELPLVGRALGVRSGALYAIGRLQEAKRDAETALELAIEVDDRRQMGAMLLRAAQASFQLGDHSAVEERLSRALAIERGRADPIALAAVHYQLGTLYNSIDEPARARDALTSSLYIARSVGDAAGEMRALMGLAWHHFESGDRDAAREHFARALDIAGRIGMGRSERIVMGYLGLIDFEAGDPATAERRLRVAAFASRRAGDPRLEAIFEGIRGAVLAALDRLDEARASFDLSKELLQGNAFYAAMIDVHRGHVDLAEARAAMEMGARDVASARIAHARARIASAYAEDAPGGALVRRSDDARMAVRILDRAIDELAAWIRET